LAAIGMVIGASWAGARAFTSTAGPGISLMNELLGLAYYAEIPVVVIDVQRVGPSTGMPTRTQQGDILECAYASHGDTKHILLFPANPLECFQFAPKAFDLAERFQTPVFILTDLDIGMNDWVVPRFSWDDSYRPDRGRVLGAEELEKIERFLRFTNEDENFVAARTLPGVDPKAAYFVRGSGHTKTGAYTEIPDEYQEVMDRLAHKQRAAARFVPAPVVIRNPGARIGIVTVGGCDAATREAIDLLAARGVPAERPARDRRNYHSNGGAPCRLSLNPARFIQASSATSWDSRFGTTKGLCRPYARGAATIPSPPRSSAPSGSYRLLRT